MARFAPRDSTFPPAARISNPLHSLAFIAFPPHGTPYAKGIGQVVTPTQGRQATKTEAGGFITMRKLKMKFKLFVLCHEYVCAVILSIFGAALTLFISG